MIFSIIIPCYNSEKYIKNAVESVLKQTYGSFEIIVIDDGSTDNTLNILKEYCRVDKRVTFFHKDNGGYSTAINYGLDKITGEYFLMMGSDDQLLPNLLEEAFDCIQNSNPDMLAFKVIKRRNGDRETDCIDTSTHFDNYLFFNGTYEDFYKKHTRIASFFSLRDTGKIFKKSLLHSLRYFGSYGFDADGYFSLLFAHRSHIFAVIPIEGYVWNIRRESLSNRSLSIDVYLDRLKNSIHLIQYLKVMDKKELANIDYEYVMSGDRIVAYLLSKSFSIFLKCYIVVVRYYFHLRRFLLKKRCLKKKGIKFILKSYFPFLCFCFVRIKGYK